jgi:hypothetical protein
VNLTELQVQTQLNPPNFHEFVNPGIYATFCRSRIEKLQEQKLHRSNMTLYLKITLSCRQKLSNKQEQVESWFLTILLGSE